MDANKVIAKKMHGLRNENSLSREAVSDLLSCDISTYSRIERGETTISPDKLVKLANYYKVNINDFFEGLVNNQTNYSYKSVNCGVQIIYKEINENLKILIKKINDK